MLHRIRERTVTRAVKEPEQSTGRYVPTITVGLRPPNKSTPSPLFAFILKLTLFSDAIPYVVLNGWTQRTRQKKIRTFSHIFQFHSLLSMILLFFWKTI